MNFPRFLVFAGERFRRSAESAGVSAHVAVYLDPVMFMVVQMILLIVQG
jgi:hypothetical protein